MNKEKTLKKISYNHFWYTDLYVKRTTDRINNIIERINTDKDINIWSNKLYALREIVFFIGRLESYCDQKKYIL